MVYGVQHFGSKCQSWQWVKDELLQFCQISNSEKILKIVWSKILPKASGTWHSRHNLKFQDRMAGKSNPWPCMAMGVLFFVDIKFGVKSAYCWIKYRWFCSTMIAPSITFQHYNDVSSPKSGLGLLLGSQNPNPRSWPSPKMIPLFQIQIPDLLQRWSHPRSTGVCPWFCFHHL